MDVQALPTARPERNREEEMALSEFFLDFSQRTTAHGLRYAVSPEVVRARRLLWLTVFLTTLGYLLYQLASLLNSYHRYPFKTVNKVVPQLSIPYPVVTLCDLNQVDSLKIDNSAMAKKLRSADPNVSYSGAVKDIFRSV
ncbi:acid-sensing ion channel 1-like protein [Elysia marginata]|uniref:Acid-sensing ion channel 1-like protein n=1 Tax=Elysia marginata TaxID=1093978 RepID=A0AAV4FF40_9GAST|nr:acid-sensing ion channel 1-like protein [Elysia marginata]